MSLFNIFKFVVGSNIGSKIELLRHQQHVNQQQRLLQQSEAELEHQKQQTRRSISMESIPSIPTVPSVATVLSQQPITVNNYGPVRASLVKESVGQGFESIEPVVTANNNRLRAINRSFRTAVDKSFDMPTANGSVKGNWMLL